MPNNGGRPGNRSMRRKRRSPGPHRRPARAPSTTSGRATTPSRAPARSGRGAVFEGTDCLATTADRIRVFATRLTRRRIDANCHPFGLRMPKQACRLMDFSSVAGRPVPEKGRREATADPSASAASARCEAFARAWTSSAGRRGHCLTGRQWDPRRLRRTRVRGRTFGDPPGPGIESIR